MTEDELRRKKRVTITDAAEYLGMPRDRLRARVKRGLYPFADGNLEEGSHRWSFYVNTEALIKWKKGEPTL